MTDYVDYLMTNYSFIETTDYFDDYFSRNSNINMKGGGETPNKPMSGFPPIYVCDKIVKNIEKEDIRKREYTKKKDAVSLKNIMKTRRETISFI